MEVCDCCLKESKRGQPGQFWTLTNYYGISGLYCSKCYDKVSHDAWARPKNPTEYLMILLKQEKGNGKEKTS